MMAVRTSNGYLPLSRYLISRSLKSKRKRPKIRRKQVGKAGNKGKKSMHIWETVKEALQLNYVRDWYRRRLLRNN